MKGVEWQHMASTTPCFPSHCWCTVWHGYGQCTTKKMARVMCWMRVLSTTMVLVKCVVAMKPWCVGQHCVVIQSLHHHPTMCMCALWCVWIGVCDGACMTNGVCVVVEGDWWHLWLVAWLCHPYVCLFAIHHKWHSPCMLTFCCTTPNGWQEDLVTCHHALVGCFVTTPFPFPTTIVSSSFSNHPFFSCPLHLGCLLIVLEMNFDDTNKRIITFLPIPVDNCLRTSIL